MSTPWLELIPTLVGLVAVIVLPGAVALYLVGMRGPLVWTVAPAVISGVYGVAAVVFDVVGLRWSLPWVGVLVAALWAGCWLAGRALARRGIAVHRPSRGPGSDAWVWVGGALGGALLIGIVAAAMVDPAALRQGFDSHDAMFHLNAIRSIRDTGNASSFDGLIGLYGATRASAFYPAVWHSMVAIAPWSAAISPAANASTFVFLAVWSLGIAALTREVFPSRPEAALIAPVVAALFGVYPNPSFGTHAQWPWGAALAMVPGVLAVAWAAVRPELPSGRWSVPLVVVAVLGAAGTVIMHGSAVATLAVFAVPALAVVFLCAVGRARARGRAAVIRILVPGLAGAALVVLLGALAWQSDLFNSVRGFPRDERMPADAALRYALRGFAPEGMPRQMWPLVLLLIVGIVAAFALRAGQWLVVALAATIALFVAAAGPEGTPLRDIAGLWYTDSLRISAFYPVAAAPIVALGFSVVARAVMMAVRLVIPGRFGSLRTVLTGSTLVGTATATVVTAAGLGAVLVHTDGARLGDIRSDFVATYSPPVERRLITPDTQHLLERMGDLLPSDAVLLGEPFTGAAYAYALGGVRVAFPQAALTNLSEDQRTVITEFNQIHSDPAVCDAVRRLGITYFWDDRSAQLPSIARAPGLFDVDVSSGFELVASSDSVDVYRITACG